MKTSVVLPADNKPVIDLTPPKIKENGSPFHKPQQDQKRLKLLLWGVANTKKTRTSMQFPKPAIMDMERGTVHYTEEYPCEVMYLSDPDEIMKTVDWLLVNEHEYKTLIIDPITVYWEALQTKWSNIYLKRKKQSKKFKFEFYEMSISDWNPIKSEYKELVRKLNLLDMNIIVTAREKKKFRTEGKDFLVDDGFIWDTEKNSDYHFDTVIRIHKDKSGKLWGLCSKDRTFGVPENVDFEFSYDNLVGYMNKDNLDRKAVPIEFITDSQKEDLIRLCDELGVTEMQILDRIKSYDAEVISELTKDNADIILNKLRQARKER